MIAPGASVAQLTLLTVLDVRIDSRLAGRFRCTCGEERDLPIGRVESGRIQSCGCLQLKGRTPKHGMRNSPEYRSWTAMKSRCLNPHSKDYARYGAAGISICDEWRVSFEAFYAYLGPRPDGTTLDRINPRGNYEPGNVRWSTLDVQAANQVDGWTVEIDGETYPSMEAAARAHGVAATTIVRWCDGSVDDRHSTPPRAGCRRWRTHA